MKKESILRLDNRVKKMKIEIELIKQWDWRLVKSGYSKHEFSKKTRVHKESLSRWLNGHSHPSKINIDRVEKTLKELGV